MSFICNVITDTIMLQLLFFPSILPSLCLFLHLTLYHKMAHISALTSYIFFLMVPPWPLFWYFTSCWTISYRLVLPITLLLQIILHWASLHTSLSTLCIISLGCISKCGLTDSRDRTIFINLDIICHLAFSKELFQFIRLLAVCSCSDFIAVLLALSDPFF